MDQLTDPVVRRVAEKIGPASGSRPLTASRSSDRRI